MAQKNKTYANSGVIIGACTLLGIGIGELAGQVGPGTLIGIAVGLLGMVFVRSR